MAEIIEMSDNGSNVDWDKVHAIFGNETEDNLTGGKTLLEVYDDFGYDPVKLLKDGNLTYTDRNSGVNSFTTTPPKDLSKFISNLRELLEADG